MLILSSANKTNIHEWEFHVVNPDSVMLMLFEIKDKHRNVQHINVTCKLDERKLCDYKSICGYLIGLQYS